MNQVWPTFEKLQSQLEKWQSQHEDTMKLEIMGESAQGRPVYAIRMTDPTVDSVDKQHVLITALHAGVERSATTSIFYLMDWLLSDSSQAREILRHQELIIMPVVNPDGYILGTHSNTQGKDPYVAWTLDGPADPENTPEAVAVQTVMDQFQPDIHADLHGLSLNFAGYIMMENSGASYSNLALRPYHSRIAQLMDEAALAAGYPSDMAEQDAEQLVWGPMLDTISHKLWTGRPRPYAAIYCYNHYHSLVLASEIGWERSGFIRHRRLLQVGNEVWPGEYYAGYPTRVIMKSNLHMVTAYGQTAAERRRSRIELWNKQQQITLGIIDPQVEGKFLDVLVTSKDAAEKYLRDLTIKGFTASLEGCPQINSKSIQQFVEDWPVGQNFPEATLSLKGNSAKAEESAPIEHGISFRLRIPYTKASLTDLRVNGHPVNLSERDGYITWVARGYTHVQINIPPKRSKAEDFFVITCRYAPGEERNQGRWESSE